MNNNDKLGFWEKVKLGKQTKEYKRWKRNDRIFSLIVLIVLLVLGYFYWEKNDYNEFLANVLGNLVNRTISMAHKYFNGNISCPTTYTDLDEEFKKTILDAKKETIEKMDELRVADAIEVIFNLFRRCNKYIDETTPWVLAKDESQKERLNDVLYLLLEGIRHGAVLLQAFLPDTANSIFEQIHTTNTSFESLDTFEGLGQAITVGEAHPLFARIDKEKKLEEIHQNQ